MMSIIKIVHTITMNHDDGNLVKELNKSDIILLGVSRTSKTHSNLFSNKGFKTSNIPLVNENYSTNSKRKSKNGLCDRFKY